MKERISIKNYQDKERQMTPLEEQKANILKNKLLKYEKIVRGNDELQIPDYYPAANIEYYTNIGYISQLNKTDKSQVYFYGKEENEAFINLIIEYENSVNADVEYKRRNELIEDFKNRFGKEINYQSIFYYAELSLQNIRKYFKDKIPTIILDNYNEYINRYFGSNYKFDIEKNQIINTEKQKTKIRIFNNEKRKI